MRTLIRLFTTWLTVVPIAAFAQDVSVSAQAASVAFLEIGAPDGAEVHVGGLNNRGVVVGAIQSREVGTVPFLWDARDGFQQILGELGGPFTGTAVDINDSGAVVGVMLDGTAPTGFIWTRRQGLQRLSGFVPSAINNKGQVAGTCVSGIERIGACIWDDGAITLIEAGDAFGINDRGEVVGRAGTAAFIWSSRTGTIWLRHNVNASIGDTDDGVTLGPNPITAAADVNDRGEVVGYACCAELVPGATYAAVWDRDRKMRTLQDHPSSVTMAISRAGWIVGWYVDPRDPDQEPQAFAWGPGGEFLDLGPGKAVDISDAGVIVGTALIDGRQQLVQWRVVQNNGILAAAR